MPEVTATVNSDMKKYYALFGDYNKYNKTGGTYEYHNGMSENELVELMKRSLLKKSKIRNRLKLKAMMSILSNGRHML